MAVDVRDACRLHRIARTRRPFSSKPRPAPIMVWPAVATKVLATLVAGFAFGLIAPIPWWTVGMAWGYAMAWMLLLDRVKVEAYRHLALSGGRHRRFLDRLQARLHSAAAVTVMLRCPARRRPPTRAGPPRRAQPTREPCRRGRHWRRPGQGHDWPVGRRRVIAPWATGASDLRPAKGRNPNSMRLRVRFSALDRRAEGCGSPPAWRSPLGARRGASRFERRHPRTLEDIHEAGWLRWWGILRLRDGPGRRRWAMRVCRDRRAWPLARRCQARDVGRRRPGNPDRRACAADGQPAMTRPPRRLQQGGYQASRGRSGRGVVWSV
jgi:hypothetical protein